MKYRGTRWELGHQLPDSSGMRRDRRNRRRWKSAGKWLAGLLILLLILGVYLIYR
jgi:hypothetical protein